MNDAPNGWKEAPNGRDDHSADERPITDGGAQAVSGPTRLRTVVDRTGRTSAADVPRLGATDRRHLFGPAELPPWALSLPVVGGLAVAVGAQGSTVLSAGGGSAWLGTVLASIGILVVVSLALRSV